MHRNGLFLLKNHPALASRPQSSGGLPGYSFYILGQWLEDFTITSLSPGWQGL